MRWIAGLYPNEPPPEDFDLVVRVPSLFLPYGGLSTPAIQRSQRPFFRPHQFLSERYFEVPEEVRRPVMNLDWHTEAWVAGRAARRAARARASGGDGRTDRRIARRGVFYGVDWAHPAVVHAIERRVLDSPECDFSAAEPGEIDLT